MGEPDYTEFVERLNEIRRRHGFTQTELARKSELKDSQISGLMAGETERITETPVLKCIKGLLKLGAITTRDEVEDLLVFYFTGKGKDFLHIEQLGQEGKDILALLPKPKYYTRRTELIGRDECIDEIVTALLDSKTRLLTLVGIPGVGKTELARQIAKHPTIHVYFSLPDISLISLEGVTHVADMLQRIRPYLPKARQRTLVILDNCEEIRDTSETIRDFSDFLESHKKLTILATSRRPLHLGSNLEVKQEILPLAVPDYTAGYLENCKANGAIELFRQAALKSQSDFQLTEDNIRTVAAICKALGGLPLALIIAASWVGYEPINQIYEWIESSMILIKTHETDTQWQQSLEHLIDKSYHLLLTKVQQTLFRRLSIFKEPCGTEFVMRVCIVNDDLPRQEISNYLRRLDDLHLITYQDGLVSFRHNLLHMFAEEMQEKDQDEKFLLKAQFAVCFYSWLLHVFSVVTDSRERYQQLDNATFNIVAAIEFMSEIRIFYLMHEIRHKFGKERFFHFMETHPQEERLFNYEKAREIILIDVCVSLEEEKRGVVLSEKERTKRHIEIENTLPFEGYQDLWYKTQKIVIPQK